MDNRDPRELVIERALKPALDWPVGKVWNSRSDCTRFAELKAGAASEVLEALHDAGYSVRRMGAELEPSVTSKAVAPYTTEVRAEIPLPAELVWITYQLGAQYAGDRRFIEQTLPRVLARQLLGGLEEPLAERIAGQLANLELELPEAARG